MRILGIESSCDDTGIAIYDSIQGVLAHSVNSQTATHALFGGVVPELASRDHIRNITPLLNEVLEKAHMKLEAIHGVAYTKGPGLIGSLLVGAGFAQALGYALGVPTVGIHHMEGHLLAPMLESPAPEFPFLALLVSGGHTLLIEVLKVGHYQILGESLDDAAGEAFDKIAKLLGLQYPGGPLLAELAKSGVPHRFNFPKPLTHKPGLNFSFSGLKTSVMNTLKQTQNTPQDKADIAWAFQEAVVDTLVLKCQRALDDTQQPRLVIAGGVGANQRLREKLSALSKTRPCTLYYPRLEFCTDNGAMIAYAGYQRLKNGAHDSLAIQVRPRWPMQELQP